MENLSMALALAAVLCPVLSAQGWLTMAYAGPDGCAMQSIFVFPGASMGNFSQAANSGPIACSEVYSDADVSAYLPIIDLPQMAKLRPYESWNSTAFPAMILWSYKKASERKDLDSSGKTFFIETPVTIDSTHHAYVIDAEYRFDAHGMMISSASAGLTLDLTDPRNYVEKHVADAIIARLQAEQKHIRAWIDPPKQPEITLPPIDVPVLDALLPSSGYATINGVPNQSATRAIPTFKVQPQYSERARRAKIQGTLYLEMTVDRSGIPHDIHVTGPLGYGLDEEAISAASQWRFKPATENGAPVPCRLGISMSFSLM